MDDIFESSVRSAGDLAGVFEFDGESSFFYLCRISHDGGQKILDTIQMPTDLASYQVLVQWNANEKTVGVTISGILQAAFKETGEKFGGTNRSVKNPIIPMEIREEFQLL